MKWIAPWSKLICPFCFEKFHLRKAHTRDDSSLVPKETDDKVGGFLQKASPMLGGITVPENNFIDYFLMRKIQSSDQYRVCPHCHMPLPHRTAKGEISSKTVAVIGARSSGKSNYFGVLVEELKNKIGHDVGFTMIPQDTFSFKQNKSISSEDIYQAQYREPLYQKRRAVDQTQKAQTDPQSKLPLIYRIQFRPKKGIGSARESQAIDLVFFDAAGEDLQTREGIKNFCRYIFGASGIIFLIDPLDYPDVRSSLSSHVRSQLDPVQKDPDRIITEVIGIFDSYKDVNRINIPVAFVLSKSDMLKRLLSRSSSLYQEPSHHGGFDEDDAREVSEEVRDLIVKWKSTHLEDLAKEHFHDHAFFAISSLGALPDKTLTLGGPISPKRVADPLLWLFWKNNLIPSLAEWTFPQKSRPFLEIFLFFFLGWVFYSNLGGTGRIYYWEYLKAFGVVGGSCFLGGVFSSLPQLKQKLQPLKGGVFLVLAMLVMFISPTKYFSWMISLSLAWGIGSLGQWLLVFFYTSNLIHLKKIPQNNFGMGIWSFLNCLVPFLMSILFIQFIF